MDTSIFLSLIIPFTMAFILTLVLTPYFIRKFKESGIVVLDYYKKNKPEVPTKGGLIILFVTLVSISIGGILSFFTDLPQSTFTFSIATVLTLFGLSGILDDLVNIGRPAKLISLYFFSFPLIHLISTSSIDFPLIGSIDFGIFYAVAVIPIYVMVTANLVNMHSGFNGLASGTSLIILVTLLAKSVIVYPNQVDNLFALICIISATLAFFWYNRYPSRMFWGNIGALTVGSAIGIFIVIQGFIISGFIMLIPHTINFLMYVYWRIKRYPQTKFGEIRDDGTIKVPNRLTLKWFFAYYKRLTEKQATYIMYLLTAVFCAISFFIPG